MDIFNWREIGTTANETLSSQQGMIIVKQTPFLGIMNEEKLKSRRTIRENVFYSYLQYFETSLKLVNKVQLPFNLNLLEVSESDLKEIQNMWSYSC